MKEYNESKEYIKWHFYGCNHPFSFTRNAILEKKKRKSKAKLFA